MYLTVSTVVVCHNFHIIFVQSIVDFIHKVQRLMKHPADGQIGVGGCGGNQLLLERVRGCGTFTCMAAFCIMGSRSWKASWMYVLLLEACKQTS